MRIDVIASTLPPVLDGIGDYTVDMVSRLARSADIRILTARGQTPDAIPAVAIEAVFDAGRRRSILNFADVVRERAPDWVLLQYNPFCYGKWGFNPYVGTFLRTIRRESTGTRVAVMVHETYVPFISLKMTIMAMWQRWQMREVARAADVLFCSCDSWVEEVTAFVQDRPVITLPVGSNIARAPITYSEARQRLKISDDQFVLGVFGVGHPSRMPERVRAAAEQVRALGMKPLLLYLGPDRDTMAHEVGDLPVIADGVQPADEISRRFAAMDLHLAAYIDGVSCRRTAFMTGIQHGIATVGTHGVHTDALLRRANGGPILLADAYKPEEFVRHVACLATDTELRKRTAAAGAAFYRDEFDRDTMAVRLIDTLKGLQHD